MKYRCRAFKASDPEPARKPTCDPPREPKQSASNPRRDGEGDVMNRLDLGPLD